MKKLLLVAVAFCSLTSFAQSLSNQLNYPKGKKLEMVITVKSTLSQGMGDAKLDASITRSFDFNDLQGANAIVEHKIKRVQVNFESMMGKETFDSENADDLKSENGKEIEKALKNKYTMTLDPKGIVVSVKKDDDNPNQPTTQPGVDMISTLLSQISAGLDIPKPGDKTDFALLPNQPVNIGQSWSDSSNQSRTVYTVDSITSKDVFISFTENGTVNTTQEVMGMQVKMSSVDNTKGTIRLDRKTGLLMEKTAETDSDGNMEAMGQKAPVSRKTTRTWTVK